MPKNKKRKRKLYEVIAEFCEIPQDAVRNLPVVTICGHHEIEVYGCSGIAVYEECRIILKLRSDYLTVTGDHLVLSDFRENILFVRGNITGASFGEAYNNV